MATLRQLKRKIASAEQLQSVVKTMRTIAAVSIRQFERASESLEDYQKTVELGLQVILANRPERVSPSRTSEMKKAGAIVFGSDQGMAGQFNQVITDFTVKTLRSWSIAESDILVLTVGERAHSNLNALGIDIDENISVPSSVNGITPTVQKILLKIEQWRSEENLQYLFLLFNNHISGSSFEPESRSLLPIDYNWLQEIESREWPSKMLPTFSMDWDTLFSALIRQYLFVSLYRACAESLASENASRLASMQAAEKNVDERLDDLNTDFRQERQRSITEELLDIVAGAEALS